MRVGARAKLHLLDLDDLLLLARLGFAFLLFILVLAVIHDLADRGIGIRRYFHKIQPGLFGHLESRSRGNDPGILAIGPDEADFIGANFVIDPWAGVTRRWRVVRSASYGIDPLMMIRYLSCWNGKIDVAGAAFKSQYRLTRADSDAICPLRVPFQRTIWHR